MLTCVEDGNEIKLLDGDKLICILSNVFVPGYNILTVAPLCRKEEGTYWLPYRRFWINKLVVIQERFAIKNAIMKYLNVENVHFSIVELTFEKNNGVYGWLKPNGKCYASISEANKRDAMRYEDHLYQNLEDNKQIRLNKYGFFHKGLMRLILEKMYNEDHAAILAHNLYVDNSEQLTLAKAAS